MTTLGFCAHFSPSDDPAFELAFRLVKMNNWQLTICHWLHSPYRLRRDMVSDDLLKSNEIVQVSPKLVTRLELQLRQAFDCRLEDFTNVAFKLCEGQYQVELARCFRNHLLDLVVMGYPTASFELEESGLPIEEFAARMKYPLIIVNDRPTTFLLNQSALSWLDQLQLPEGSWQLIDLVPVS